MKISLTRALLATLLLAPGSALADAVNAADTAWIMTSTALVLFMTLPGLALFYGGLVRSKNVLSVLMQCFATAGIASILWLLIGYIPRFLFQGPMIVKLNVAVSMSDHTMGLGANGMAVASAEISEGVVAGGVG